MDIFDRFGEYHIYSINRPGCLLFFQHFQQARTFLENNKTRDKFVSPQQDKQGAKSNVDNIKVH